MSANPLPEICFPGIVADIQNHTCTQIGLDVSFINE